MVAPHEVAIIQADPRAVVMIILRDGAELAAPLIAWQIFNPTSDHPAVYPICAVPLPDRRDGDWCVFDEDGSAVATSAGHYSGQVWNWRDEVVAKRAAGQPQEGA
jgi:hypothetical protein